MTSNKDIMNVVIEHWPHTEKPFVVLERKNSFDDWSFVDRFTDEYEAVELALSRSEKVKFLGVRDKEVKFTGSYFFPAPAAIVSTTITANQSEHNRTEIMLKNR